MKTIVITGSTRGIGFGLAEAFLAQGCSVVISGRTRQAIDEATSKLSLRYDPARIFETSCDVSDFNQVQDLWDAAQDHYGKIDIWINNAGMAHPQTDIQDYTPELIHKVLDTNLAGVIQGTTIALRGMYAQGSGAIYNVEGFGSNGGRMVSGLGLYGSSKAALRFFDDNLFQEVEGTSIIAGALQPGMVITDLITNQYQNRPEDWERAKRIFNIIGNRVEDVAPWLADQILKNTKNGVRFSYTSPAKIMLRFLTAPIVKRNIIDE